MAAERDIVIHVDPKPWELRRRFRLWRWLRSDGPEMNVTLLGQWPSARRVPSFYVEDEAPTDGR